MTTIPITAVRQALDDTEAALARLRPALGAAYGTAGQSLTAAAGQIDVAERARAAAEQRADRAHAARRAKAAQLDDIKRALLDTGVIQEGDPYGHADLADVIRQTMTDRAHTERGDTAAAHLDRSAGRKEAHDRACKTIADMHEAATGRTGMGPIRGVVEDVADVRARAELAEHRATRWEAARHTWQAKAVEMEADRDREAAAREQAQQDTQQAEKRAHDAEQALSALRGVTDTARAEAAEAERDQAQRDAKEAKERARIAHVAAYRLQQRTPDAAQRVLDRIRNARHTGTVWTELGMYYGLTAGQAGQGARAWRSMAERLAVARAEKAEERAETASALGARYMGYAERYRAAWQNARLRARAHLSEQQRIRGWLTHWADRARTAESDAERFHAAWHSARDRAQREASHSRVCRISRDAWRHRATAAMAATSRVRELHSAVVHNGRTICTDCSGYADGSTDNGPAPFPCPTITALDHARYTTEAGR
ncbi:hypothetical protein [Streptomyces sp. NPDC006267]|uniref:hypothetical protein n=1 Tax=Streptomyces sp. NPDC006267 TaxID=3157173 RepID=UPI0033A9F40F